MRRALQPFQCASLYPLDWARQHIYHAVKCTGQLKIEKGALAKGVTNAASSSLAAHGRNFET
jgi:hypothetical protein